MTRARPVNAANRCMTDASSPTRNGTDSFPEQEPDDGTMHRVEPTYLPDRQSASVTLGADHLPECLGLGYTALRSEFVASAGVFISKGAWLRSTVRIGVATALAHGRAARARRARASRSIRRLVQESASS